MKSEIKKLNFLVSRNIKLYFKDKLTFFLSLLSPLILILLFLLFLRGVYEQSLVNSLPEGMEISQNLINAFTGGWLFSSIMSVSCITVAFCSNMLAEDKLKKILPGLEVAPVNKATLKTSYVISNFIVTMLVCLIIFAISLIYLAIVGWFLSFIDILIILADMVITVFIGTLIISIISNFIKSQGAFSATCTLISSMYGFICGAYMPIAQMGEWIKYFVSFIPGTYSTILFRQGYMNGILKEINKTIPDEAITAIRESFDGTFKFFGHEVAPWVMFLIIIIAAIFLFGILMLIINLQGKTKLQKSHFNNITKNHQ